MSADVVVVVVAPLCSDEKISMSTARLPRSRRAEGIERAPKVSRVLSRTQLQPDN